LRPAQTPKFAATLSGSWQQGGKSAEIVLSRIGAQYEDDLNTRVLKSATTLDASASLPIAHHLELVARAENITNALVMAALNSDGSIERATPRTLWIGLRLR
jgi:outer membrane receptor protein involved in Fe transport